MKTLKLFLLLSLVYSSANAQITKGNWLLGGNGEYTNQTYKFDNGTSAKFEKIIIKPNFGYFIKDNFAAGSSLRFENQDIFTTYGIGVFSRYYFLKPEKPFNLFIQAHFDFAQTISKDQDRGSDAKVNSHLYGVRIGQVVFFNNVIGLEFAIEYERGNSRNYDSDNIKAVLGFQIHLEK